MMVASMQFLEKRLFISIAVAEPLLLMRLWKCELIEILLCPKALLRFTAVLFLLDIRFAHVSDWNTEAFYLLLNYAIDLPIAILPIIGHVPSDFTSIF